MTPKKRQRRPGVKPTVGLIVEGDAEYIAFPRLHSHGIISGCPPLKATNLGGVGATTAASGIAKMVAPKIIEHQVAGRTKVVICVDREQRERCAPGFAADILSALAAEFRRRGRALADVHVVVADRAFEAWLLAGARGLFKRGKLKKEPRFNSFEGALGQQARKGVVELSVLLERPYAKTSDGPDLLVALDFAEARNHANGHGSKSLDKFLRILGV